MSIRVVLTTPYLKGAIPVGAIAAVDPRMTVQTCEYVESAAQRNARSWPTATPDGSRLSGRQRAAFADAHVLVALDVPYDLPVLAPELRWCHVVSSGTGHIAGSGLPHEGVAVTHGAGGNAPGVAEFVLARILEHVKLLPELAHQQQLHHWEMTPGGRVAGRRLVIIGLGHIGREVAHRATALGMEVVAVVRRPRENGRHDVTWTTDLVGAVAEADVTVLCASDRPQNRELIDARVIAAMRSGSFFINVSRGDLVDEAALADSLRSGRLAAAALDVTVDEPLPPDHHMWTVPNLRLSFHSASTQDGMLSRRIDMFVANLRRWLAGQPLSNTVPDFSATDMPMLP